MKWTAKHERAAFLVAEDTLSDVKIAQQVGISKRTLEMWKAEPEFSARVKAFVEAIAKETEQYGIARMHQRVARLNADYKALQQIVSDRAAFYIRQREEAEVRIAALEAAAAAVEAAVAERAADCCRGEVQTERGGICFHPGMETGWLLVQYKRHGVDIVLDAATEAALRALEQQAAKELGQWSDRAETRDYDMSQFDDAELERLLAGEPIDRVLASSRRRRAREAPTS